MRKVHVPYVTLAGSTPGDLGRELSIHSLHVFCVLVYLSRPVSCVLCLIHHILKEVIEMTGIENRKK
jgi:hypothetical protein